MLKKLKVHIESDKKDIAEFEVVFKAHYKSLCMVAYGIVKNTDTAEEIVQEFFYYYWLNRKTLKIKTSLKAYFYKSVYNRSLKHLRSLSVRQKHADFIKSQDNSSDNFLEKLEAKELWDIIEQILNEIPQNHANIFRMNRYQGMKYKEIAEVLSISVKTVEAAMGKALAILRKRLSAYTEVSGFKNKTNILNKEKQIK